jgi:hypothetical protein
MLLYVLLMILFFFVFLLSTSKFLILLFVVMMPYWAFLVVTYCDFTFCLNVPSLFLSMLTVYWS